MQRGNEEDRGMFRPSLAAVRSPPQQKLLVYTSSPFPGHCAGPGCRFCHHCWYPWLQTVPAQGTSDTGRNGPILNTGPNSDHSNFRISGFEGS
eukprot:376554-Pelagomonas_calceolata.AAC.1